MQLTHFDAQDTRIIPPLTKRPLGDAIRCIERAMKARCSNYNLVLQQLMRVTLARVATAYVCDLSSYCNSLCV